MQKIILGTVIAAFGALNVCAAFAQDMTLTSTEVADGATIKEAQVANVFGCQGGNISPSLNWSGAPSDTKSFAITVYDPDAPTGSGFWHWIVFNIAASTSSIPQNAGDVKRSSCPKAPSRAVPILAPTATAVRARRKAISHTTTFLQFMRSMRTSCNSPRITMSRRPSSALNCISTARRRLDLRRPTAVDFPVGATPTPKRSLVRFGAY